MQHIIKTLICAEDSEDDHPPWQKEAQESYSSGEEEAFFGIPKRHQPVPTQESFEQEAAPKPITWEEVATNYDYDHEQFLQDVNEED